MRYGAFPLHGPRPWADGAIRVQVSSRLGVDRDDFSIPEAVNSTLASEMPFPRLLGVRCRGRSILFRERVDGEPDDLPRPEGRLNRIQVWRGR